MKRTDLTEKILDIKREKNWVWKFITDQIGGMSPVLVVGALLGQMKLTRPMATKPVVRAVGARRAYAHRSPGSRLNQCPLRSTYLPVLRTRGDQRAWKALIEEEFRDGITSAIDFDLQIDRLADSRGDRVRLIMSGKFLPYKYYGNDQGCMGIRKHDARSPPQRRWRPAGDTKIESDSLCSII
jgi:cyanate lyase